MQHPYQRTCRPSDDDCDMHSDAGSDMPSAAESASPSDVPVTKVERAYYWFFKVTLVVGKAHIVDNKISRRSSRLSSDSVTKIGKADYRKCS